MGHRRSGRKLVALLAAVVLLPLVGASSAAAPPPPARQFERVPVAGIDPRLLPVAIDDARAVTVMLELSGEPVARQ